MKCIMKQSERVSNKFVLLSNGHDKNLEPNWIVLIKP